MKDLKDETLKAFKSFKVIARLKALKYAKDLKADALITGHYVERIKNNGRASIYL